MKPFSQTFRTLALTALMLGASPVVAQVSGKIATVNTLRVVLDSTALNTAYEQIQTTYASQITTLNERTQQRANLIRQFDTNGDGQIDPSEQAAANSSPNLEQIKTLETEMKGLSDQIDGARVYAIEQVLEQYRASLKNFVDQQQIQLVLSPDVLIYAPAAANITSQVKAAVNAAKPSVTVVPPADWRPTREAVAMYQQVQQAVLTAAQIRAAQQQQQPQQEQSQQQQQPATQAPSGR